MQFQEITAQSATLGVALRRQERMSFRDSPSTAGISAISAIKATSFGDYQVIRRNGSVVAFEPSKIAVAMTKAFIAVRGGQGAGSAAVREQVEKLTDGTVRALLRRLPAGGTFHIEDVQDQVELSLMRDGAHDVARSMFCTARNVRRNVRSTPRVPATAPKLSMLENGVRVRWICRASSDRPRGVRRTGRLCNARRHFVGDGHESLRRSAARRGLQVGHSCRARADRRIPPTQQLPAITAAHRAAQAVKRSPRSRCRCATPMHFRA